VLVVILLNHTKYKWYARCGFGQNNSMCNITAYNIDNQKYSMPISAFRTWQCLSVLKIYAHATVYNTDSYKVRVLSYRHTSAFSRLFSSFNFSSIWTTQCLRRRGVPPRREKSVTSLVKIARGGTRYPGGQVQSFSVIFQI
jgi:hypothetical protein